MAKHANSGKCLKCSEILRGVDQTLIDWFTALQKVMPDAHVAWGLRGKKDQDDAFKKGTSKAKWGESPHNYGLAIDLFRLTQAGGASFDAPWYRDKIAPEVRKNKLLFWGGDFKSFSDKPHVELNGWKNLVTQKKIPLCE